MARWGKKKLSSGLIAFVFFILLMMAATATALLAEINDWKFPEIQSEEPSEKKKGRKR